MKTTLAKETSHRTEPVPAEEFVSPAVNVCETKDGYVLEAEMPGVGKDGLEITLENNELTIIGRRIRETVSAEPLFRECSAAHFRRVFELDPAIDTNRINAKVSQGVLTLTLPKSERVKPRKITVDD
jgi:HSP20 family protein